jgi:23S rRNA pseudouridine1911/1915/1917 synthase
MLSEMGEASALWLVHRLDRVVGGTVVFARNKRTAAALSELFSTQSTEKEYLAVVEGVAEGGVLEDLLYKDSAKGKAFVVDRKRAGVKEARLEYAPIATADTERGVYTLVRVKLHTGRFHQIRAQLALAGMHIINDRLYGAFAVENQTGHCLHSLAAAFLHPSSGTETELRTNYPSWAIL